MTYRLPLLGLGAEVVRGDGGHKGEQKDKHDYPVRHGHDLHALFRGDDGGRPSTNTKTVHCAGSEGNGAPDKEVSFVCEGETVA